MDRVKLIITPWESGAQLFKYFLKYILSSAVDDLTRNSFEVNN